MSYRRRKKKNHKKNKKEKRFDRKPRKKKRRKASQAKSKIWKRFCIIIMIGILSIVTVLVGLYFVDFSGSKLRKEAYESALWYKDQILSRLDFELSKKPSKETSNDLRRKGKYYLRLGDKKNMRSVSDALMEEFDDWYGYYLDLELQRNSDKGELESSVSRIEHFLSSEIKDSEERFLATKTLLSVFHLIGDQVRDYGGELFFSSSLDFETLYHLFASSTTTDLRKRYFQHMLRMNRDDSLILMCYHLLSDTEFEFYEKQNLLWTYYGSEDVDLNEICDKEPTAVLGSFIKGSLFKKFQDVERSNHYYEKALVLLRELGEKVKDHFDHFFFPIIYYELLYELSMGYFSQRRWDYSMKYLFIMTESNPSPDNYVKLCTTSLLNEKMDKQETKIVLVENYEKMKKTHPGEISEFYESFFEAGNIQYRSDDFDGCVRSLQLMEEAFPSYSEDIRGSKIEKDLKVLEGFCGQHSTNEEFRERSAQNSEWHEAFQGDPREHAEKGYMYFEKGDYVNAIEEYSACVVYSLHDLLVDGEDMYLENLENLENVVDMSLVEDCVDQRTVCRIRLGQFEVAEAELLDITYSLGLALDGGYDKYMSALRIENKPRVLFEVTDRVINGVCCPSGNRVDDGVCLDRNQMVMNRRFVCDKEMIYLYLLESGFFRYFENDEDRLKAVENLEKAKNMDNSYCVLYDVLFNIYRELKDYVRVVDTLSEGIELCKKLHEMDPSTLEEKKMAMYSDRSFHENLIGRYDDAIADSDYILKKIQLEHMEDYEKYDRFWGMMTYSKSYGLEKKEFFNEALDGYLSLMEGDGEERMNFKYVTYRVGMVYRELGEFEKALDYFITSFEMEKIQDWEKEYHKEELDRIGEFIEEMEKKIAEKK